MNDFQTSIAGMVVDSAFSSSPLYAGGRPLVVTALTGDCQGSMLLWYLCLGKRDQASCVTDDTAQGLISHISIPFDGALSTSTSKTPTDFMWFSVRAKPNDYICRMSRTEPDFQAQTSPDYIYDVETCQSSAKWCCKSAANFTSATTIVMVDFAISDAFAYSQTSAAHPEYANRLFFASQALVDGVPAGAVIPVTVTADGDFTIETPKVLTTMSEVTSLAMLSSDLQVSGVTTDAVQSTETLAGVALKSTSAMRKGRAMQKLNTNSDPYSPYVVLDGYSNDIANPETVACQHDALVNGLTTAVGSLICTFSGVQQVVEATYEGTTYEFVYRLYKWTKPESPVMLVVVETTQFNAATTDAQREAAVRAEVYDHTNDEISTMLVDVANLTAADVANTPVTQQGRVYVAVNTNSPSAIYKIRASDLSVAGLANLQSPGCVHGSVFPQPSVVYSK